MTNIQMERIATAVERKWDRADNRRSKFVNRRLDARRIERARRQAVTA